MPDAPNFKKLFKCLNKKDKENDILGESVGLVDISEFIREWQCDEDDFVLGDGDIKNQNSFEESGLVEKFSSFYIKLSEGVSEDEIDLKEEEEVKMIIDDTLYEDKVLKETSLNDLFANEKEQDDDDLKYLENLNGLEQKSMNFCINETICENDEKPINKGIEKLIKQEIKMVECSPIIVVQTSTSTPRSILKKAKISYSPLSLSPEENKVNKSSFGNNTQNGVSMVGMTQALDLINSTNIVQQKSPILTSQMVNLFDMKSTLWDLFENEEESILLENKMITPENELRSVNLVKSSESVTRTRRLRFDEASIMETSCFKKQVPSENEDSFILNKKVIFFMKISKNNKKRIFYRSKILFLLGSKICAFRY